VDGRLIDTGRLVKRTKTSNRLGLDLGPGDGNATVTIDEMKVFARDLPERDIAELKVP
jgi:hypothetical protein